MRRLLVAVVLASASALWPFSSSEKQDPPTPHPDAVPVAQQTALPRLSNYDAVDEAFAEGGALVDEGGIVLDVDTASQAAAGFVVHLFPTGQCNVIGNPIIPVIKLTANPRTASEMSEHIDLDVSPLLQRQMNLDEAGDALIDMTVRTCNGRHTAAEALGHREFVLTKLYESA